jgi:hypothetical protein
MKPAINPVLIFSITALHTGYGNHRNINKLIKGVSQPTTPRKYLRKSPLKTAPYFPA